MDEFLFFFCSYVLMIEFLLFLYFVWVFKYVLFVIRKICILLFYLMYFNKVRSVEIDSLRLF